jgi:hypothetical protein
MVDARRLAGGTEIAALLGVGRSTVGQWEARRDRTGFPVPVAELAMGRVYDLDAVVRWYGSYTPDRGGRRPKRGQRC